MENENPKNSTENHVKVFKIPIEVWAAQIKEAFENEENKGSLNPEIRIENQEFTPPVIVWERKEKTDCRYENMSEAIAARYRKLHFYLNKTHDRVVKAMKFDNHKNLNMFWMNAEQNELAISWTFSSANKIHIYKIANPVVKGKSNAGPSKEGVTYQVHETFRFKYEIQGGVWVSIGQNFTSKTNKNHIFRSSQQLTLSGRVRTHFCAKRVRRGRGRVFPDA